MLKDPATILWVQTPNDVCRKRRSGSYCGSAGLIRRIYYSEQKRVVATKFGKLPDKLHRSDLDEFVRVRS